MKKILVVEDDESVRAGLVEQLSRVGFSVDFVGSVKSFEERNLSRVDLIIMDWELPDGEGFELLKKLRFANIQIPVIMLTARDDIVDKILGLESGANDYLTKPFEVRELIARIKIHLKEKEPELDRLDCGDLSIDLVSLKVIYKEKEMRLAKMEIELLKYFMMNIGKALSRQEILDDVWGLDNYPTTRTVDMHVGILRKKICPDYFETLHGIGYRFKAIK